MKKLDYLLRDQQIKFFFGLIYCNIVYGILYHYASLNAWITNWKGTR